ncbi:cysteine--tRNA ligase [Candidatus Gottesmanbacteria bacterium RBG_13_37_7]|uniref:Cysteine--tRNA ligase n=1 Tax=Candidatus Gottesmanbacteria bacterium RBG_13_37_7 TaxID=1798369 RepID=A0A1F5YK85_9BACT|nr:MAG: cysteine--tRNA ligase [Candidatus Gottesmanbacteria bacterium RBG_13_37_7]
MLQLFNTLNRKIEDLKPLTEKEIGIYSCGPTVYWNQHIGHMYAYVHWDILVRLLRLEGYKVKWVMNITDVGHMTSDSDTGEDKMEKGAKREGITVWQIADKYIEQFYGSLDLLNIKKPDILCRATDHIKDIIDLIGKIEKNGFTYRTKTGIVFDTAKFPDYKEFAKLELNKQEAGSRVEIDPEKRQPWDFLLWVTNQPNHIMQWSSPWGRGFPGWHIECTAMSVKFLGETFDIHTGGVEHIPVHHTNEIAQGYGAFRHMTARFWLHNCWLLIEGEKMSKSLGNNVLVTDLMQKGFSPMALRYLILNSHYRQGMNFTFQALEGARNALNNLASYLIDLKDQTKKGDRSCLSLEKMEKVDKFKIDFYNALFDDLNVPSALAILWQAVKSNIPASDKLDLIYLFDEILGLRLAKVEAGKEKVIPAEIQSLAKKREELRTQKKFKEADFLRQEIEKKGYQIEDISSGSVIKPR